MVALIRFTSFALTLTLAGAAFARRPPALERLQEQSAQVLSTCSTDGESGPGYRDMYTRLGWDYALPERARLLPDAGIAEAYRRTIGQVVVGDDVVLICEGGFVREGGGYRDMNARFPTRAPTTIATSAPWGTPDSGAL